MANTPIQTRSHRSSLPGSLHSKHHKLVPPLRSLRSITSWLSTLLILAPHKMENTAQLLYKPILVSIRNLIELIQKNGNAKQAPAQLSHYRADFPPAVTEGYDLLTQGAELIHATSTKYTLVGKVSQEEQQQSTSKDLLRGCELIGTATLVLLEESSGCARSSRYAVSRASLSVLVNVQRLVESFADATALEGTVGAQKTGAVWQSCDYVIKRMMPRGNRNAMRRDLFSWTKDCQETMTEFQEMIELGPLEEPDASALQQPDEDEDDFFDGDGDKYTEDEMQVAKACIPILRCSKGTMNATLQACECLGEASQDEAQKDTHLNAISQLVELAREVGVGVTDFGSSLYPPLVADGNLQQIQRLGEKQCQAITAVHNIIIGNEKIASDTVGLSNRILSAMHSREAELVLAIQNLMAKQTSGR